MHKKELIYIFIHVRNQIYIFMNIINLSYEDKFMHIKFIWIYIVHLNSSLNSRLARHQSI